MIYVVNVAAGVEGICCYDFFYDLEFYISTETSLSGGVKRGPIHLAINSAVIGAEGS